jgi:hypothetical protein
MRVVLLFLLLVVGLTATVSGILLIMYPDGTTLRLTRDLLDSTPFHNYVAPGILLMTTVDIPHLVAFLVCFPKKVSRYQWAMGAGFLLMGWIIGRNLLHDNITILQVIYLVIGIMIVLIAWQLMGKWAV